MHGKSSLKVSACCLLAAGTAAIAWRLAKTWKLSSIIRTTKQVALGDLSSSRDNGKYVHVVGVIKAVDSETSTPESGVQCVLYRVSTVRIMEHLTTKSTARQVENQLSTSRPRRFDLAQWLPQRRFNNPSHVKAIAESRVNKGGHELARDRLSTHEHRVPWVVDDGSGACKVDLGGNLDPGLFKLERVLERFDEPKSRAKSTKSNVANVVGFLYIEEALRPGTEVRIFGELEFADPWLIRLPLSTSMFDFKTRALKPFIVTTLTQSALIAKIDKKGRWEFIAFGISALVTTIASWNFLSPST